MSFIQVAESESSEEVIEIPLEDDDTLALATLAGQFPNAIGIKYKTESGVWRGVKMSGSSISHPDGRWPESIKYIVSYSVDNKRKAEGDQGKVPKRVKQTVDLVVRNILYDTTEEELRAHFEEFGELTFVQLRKNPDGGSRGYAFIRYKNYEDQKTCVRGKHEIGDRKLEVKIPRPDGAEARHTGTVLPSRQIHLGNVTADITAEDLKEHFGQFGPIDNVIIPKPGPNGEFPMYAFVTFEDEDDAEALIESTQLHTIKGATLNLAYAAGHTMKEQYATHTPQARYKPKVPHAARAPHAPHVPHAAPAASVPAPKPQPRRKSIDAACMEIMDDFIEQIYAGKLGNEKPRSRIEATEAAVVSMKRWVARNAGPSIHDERDRYSPKHVSNRHRNEEYYPDDSAYAYVVRDSYRPVEEDHYYDGRYSNGADLNGKGVEAYGRGARDPYGRVPQVSRGRGWHGRGGYADRYPM